ncbi:MAG TPA: M20/M25/M40 family metallo-hydrolase [Gemmatimonadales bacterium]|jgi:acetylornithine deacetylase/succinyl-diaminopimelate desuccinylase-like protein|nr:M20/M25/M40 family metallo-hydrolase [Gemmatimonadales bacterium]
MRSLRTCCLLLLLLLSRSLSAQAACTPDFDALAREATSWLADYLKIETVNPPGNETAGARYLQQLLAKEGIESHIYESSPGRGNIYARLKGTGKARPIILLHHIDVVPVDSAEWTVPAFSGKIRDGYLYGRGALDDKGSGIVDLAVLVALKRRGVPLSREIIFIGNADEETSSTGADWFTTEHADLVRGAEFLINEGGDNRADTTGHTLYYGLDVTEKVPSWIRLTAHGTGGHGSMPVADNPAARIARALGRLAEWETPVTLTPPAESFLKAVAPMEKDPRHRAWLADPARALADSAGRAWLLADPYRNAILRNTVSITMMQGSNKTNIIPSRASAEVDIRLLPGVDHQEFLAAVRHVISDPLVEVTLISTPRKATSAPLRGALVDALRATVGAMDPGVPITTPMLTGFTDSYYYRRLGIGAYGIDPFRLTERDVETVHGNDERVSLENIRFGVEFFYRIVEQVAK